MCSGSLVQYPKTDRRNEENLMPPLTPADVDHSTRETPNRSSGFALGFPIDVGYTVDRMDAENVTCFGPA
jgi:hypothetical protein